MNEQSYAQTTQMILAELKTALNAVDPASVEQLLAAVQQADQVFFVGVGRVMLALEAIAKRWAHLGIKTHLVGEIPEAEQRSSLPRSRRRRIRSAQRSCISAPTPTVRCMRSVPSWFASRSGQSTIWTMRSILSSP